MYCCGGPGHLVLTPERQDLGKADVEEHAFHEAGEHDQAAQQRLVVLRGAGDERGVGQRVDERHQELVLLADRRDLMVGVEHLALVEIEALDDVLVGVGVDASSNAWRSRYCRHSGAVMWR